MDAWNNGTLEKWEIFVLFDSENALKYCKQTLNRVWLLRGSNY